MASRSYVHGQPLHNLPEAEEEEEEEEMRSSHFH